MGRDVCYPRREAAKCRLVEEARASWRQERARPRRKVRMADGGLRWRTAKDERDRGRRAKPTAFELGTSATRAERRRIAGSEREHEPH